ncbi:type II secretion system F family protein [Methylomarinum sp. Ch1-1]|uniref:Type II secretion system F family protein n=1 Tax=Methylomarinum roseum TaxID=3067653 RepID=A0AAU7NT39_9GAMM|nr:type II secretion system F family protein [Methylomarinum sp. Ch1-1]MDP4519840.1 type II secretion system F family protein [Methylomarinum sp. Ch1-1]
MDQKTLIIFLLLIAGAVFLLSQLILVPSFGTRSVESRLIKRRLKNMTEAGRAGEYSLVRKKYLRELSTLERILESLPGTDRVQDLLEQAGKTYPAYRVILAMIGLAIIVGIITWIFTTNIIAAPLAGLFAGFVPYMKLKSDRKKRLDLFEEQLPEALDMMTRALRAGYPFNEAMHYIAEEMEEPIAHEFGITFEEINYGRDVRQAFNYLLMRVPSTNLVAATTAILIQRETGGNLAELLGKISGILRQRFRFQRRVKTITAESRMSAWVLSLLPFFVFLVITLRTPDYVKPLFDTEMGNLILGGGLVLQVIGALWVRKQINFDI